MKFSIKKRNPMRIIHIYLLKNISWYLETTISKQEAWVKQTRVNILFYVEVVIVCKCLHLLLYDISYLSAAFNSFEEQTNTCTQHWGINYLDGEADEAINLI